jgi:hypothetical protein
MAEARSSAFQECADMTKKGTLTASTLGLIAFTLSVLLVNSAAHAEQCVTRGSPPFCDPSCEPGEYEKARLTGGGCAGGFFSPGSVPYQSVCCKIGEVNKGNTKSGSVNPCDDMVGPGYEYVQPSGQPGKCVPKNKKKMAKKSAAQVACEANGNQWDGGCIRPIRQMGKGKAKAECEAKGPNYRYDMDSGRCIVTKKMSKKSSSDKAEECEAKGPSYHYDWDRGQCVGGMTKRSSDYDDDDDYRPRKKKRHYEDDDWEGGRAVFEAISPFF